MFVRKWLLGMMEWDTLCKEVKVGCIHNLFDANSIKALLKNRNKDKFREIKSKKKEAQW